MENFVSDETHFLVEENRSKFVRKIADEKLTADYLVHMAKRSAINMLWGCFSYKGTGKLIPLKVSRTVRNIKHIWKNVWLQMVNLYSNMTLLLATPLE